MSFIPRSHFPFPSTAPSWFIGHMQRGLRRMKEQLSSVDLVLEVRDARLPLTSINPAFEELFGSDRGLLPKNGKKRLVVYNKRDLAEPGLERPIQRALLQHAGQLCLFSDTASDHDMRHVLRTSIKLARPDLSMLPALPADSEIKPDEIRIMIAGMPNVGKSSLLNALRRVGVHKGKAAQVGPQAGMTRKLMGTVRVWDNPITYLYDTPGMMIPYFGVGEEAVERGIKLALTSGLKENLYDPLQLADYLLYRLNIRYFHPSYPTPASDLPLYLRPFLHILPTNELQPLLQAIGQRIGAVRKGGVIDEEFAARAFIKAFRDGKLGLWALDDMGLLLKGHENMPNIDTGMTGPSRATAALTSSVAEPSDEADATQVAPYLPQDALEESMALVVPKSMAKGEENRQLPAPLDADSPTSRQVSTFVAAHFHAQRESMSELSMSKNQVKKRERLQAAEERKIKWKATHPGLSDKAKGVGGVKKGQSTFFIGGGKFRRKLEKKRYIARKVTKRRAKMR